MPLLHAHLVCLTTYRPKVSTNAMGTSCQNTIRQVCPELNAELVEVNAQAHHVHLRVSSPPTLAISTRIPPITGRTAHAVPREDTAAHVRARTRAHPWSPASFALSCRGAPLSIITQNIDSQAQPL